MSELPKRIWVEPANRSEGGNYGMWTLKSNKKSTEYLRADLLPGREILSNIIQAYTHTARGGAVINADEVADAILARIVGGK